MLAIPGFCVRVSNADHQPDLQLALTSHQKRKGSVSRSDRGLNIERILIIFFCIGLPCLSAVADVCSCRCANKNRSNFATECAALFSDLRFCICFAVFEN